jgi:hypothetical protein
MPGTLVIAATRLGGVEKAEMVEVEAIGHGLGDGDQAALLGARQTSLAKDVFAGGEDRLRRQRIDEPGQPSEDGIGAARETCCETTIEASLRTPAAKA